MRQLAILTFLSLDGVMQAPHDNNEDPTGEFTQGGWALPYWEPVMAQVQAEAMTQPYDLLLGRRTYDIFTRAHAERGASPEDPMTNATKYVVTSSPDTMTWDNSIAVTGEPHTEIAVLKQQDGQLIQVHGSWQLVQTLLAHRLVDELRLWTFPVVVGNGKRLFATDSADNFTLVKTAPAGDSGAVMTIYQPS